MMRTITFCIVILLFLLAINGPVQALSGPIVYGGKNYYAVNSADPTENTGAKVCAKAGATYIGFTARTTDVCKAFHPSAAVTSGMDGSSTGFYCNGAPQQGVCAKQVNTCNICPACNLNVDANTDISDQYREMYVECGAPSQAGTTAAAGQDDGSLLTAPTPPSFTPSFFSSFYSGIRLAVLGMYWRTADKQSLNKYLEGKWGCDFYQYPLANQKSVDCTRTDDADKFCKNKLGSASAKSEYCGSDGPGEGLIVCSKSCMAGSVPAACPADPSRMSVRETNAPAGSCSGTTAGDLGIMTGVTMPTTTSGVNLNRPTLQPGTTKTVTVQGSSSVRTVTVTGEGLSDLIVTGTTLSELPKGISQPDGQLYQYTELEPKHYTTISSASIEFVIPSSWLIARNMDSKDIVMKRYNNGAWSTLPTSVVKEDNGDVTVKADSPGFSIFWEGAYHALYVDVPEQPVLGRGRSPGQNVCPHACKLDLYNPENCNVLFQNVNRVLPTCTGTWLQNVDSLPITCSCYTVAREMGDQCPSQCGGENNQGPVCMMTYGNAGQTGVACDGIAQGTKNSPCMCVYRNGDWKYASLGMVLNAPP